MQGKISLLVLTNIISDQGLNGDMHGNQHVRCHNEHMDVVVAIKINEVSTLSKTGKGNQNVALKIPAVINIYLHKTTFAVSPLLKLIESPARSL